ncbi:hypothetical protein IPM09_04490 [Candidatus Saccharibacteria bacterium]|nr:MAG: hypothetical protein IPM09_04490 [Candidatus Saccharibacteria bacterium]
MSQPGQFDFFHTRDGRGAKGVKNDYKKRMRAYRWNARVYNFFRRPIYRVLTITVIATAVWYFTHSLLFAATAAAVAVPVVWWLFNGFRAGTYRQFNGHAWTPGTGPVRARDYH